MPKYLKNLESAVEKQSAALRDWLDKLDVVIFDAQMMRGDADKAKYHLDSARLHIRAAIDATKSGCKTES